MLLRALFRSRPEFKGFGPGHLICRAGLCFASRKETEGLEEGKGGKRSPQSVAWGFLFIPAPSGH